MSPLLLHYRLLISLPHRFARYGCMHSAATSAAHYASSHPHTPRTHRFGGHSGGGGGATPKHNERTHHSDTGADDEARARDLDEELETRSLAEMRADCEEKAHMPWSHRLRTALDVRERELERMHRVLYHRPQLLVDSKAATWSCRPASRRVVQLYAEPNQKVTDAAPAKTTYHTCAQSLPLTAAIASDGVGVRVVRLCLTRASALCSLVFHRAHPACDQRWTGTSSIMMHYYGRWRGFLAASAWNADPASAAAASLSQGACTPDGALHRARAPQQHPRPSPSTSQALAVVPTAESTRKEKDAVYDMCRLYTMGYMGRMILTPKRHVGHALYHAAWNILLGVYHGCVCVSLGLLLTLLTRHDGVRGVRMALRFVLYGCVVSPLIHIPCGLCNSLYGPMSAVTGWFVFDALSGRWMWCDVGNRPCGRENSSKSSISSTTATCWSSALQREKRVRRLVGRLECRRRRIRVEHKWTARLASLGFSAEAAQSMMRERASRTFGQGDRATKEEQAQKKRRGRWQKDGHGMPERDTMNPYEVLHVPRYASAADIKSQYKKLAMIYHPDVARSHHGGGALTEKEREEAQAAFARISAAYQILSNPSQRRAYDQGGSMGLRLYHTQFAPFLLQTVEEMIQAIFGGEPFRRYLVGEFLRSPWSLRYEGMVSLSLHEYEELQCIRMRQLAGELAAMVDTYAKTTIGSAAAGETGSTSTATATGPVHYHRSSCNAGIATDTPDGADFASRCDRFVTQLSCQSFGKELLYEVGEAYVVGAQRFLGHAPFYAPKLLQTRKIFTGMDRVLAEFLANMKLEKHALTRKLMSEFLSMEYDIIVADLHTVLRYVVQIVLQDVSESAAVRHRRACAVQMLGEKMKAKGKKWHGLKSDDYAELLAYIQQAATSNAAAQRGEAVRF